jgi:hypothetical protein
MFALPLATVAEMVVARVVKAELLEKAREKKARTATRGVSRRTR